MANKTPKWSKVIGFSGTPIFLGKVIVRLGRYLIDVGFNLFDWLVVESIDKPFDDGKIL